MNFIEWNDEAGVKKTFFHPQSRLGKGFEAPGERWNIAIKSLYVGDYIGLFLVKKVYDNVFRQTV
jgi:hypothetical protein